MFKPSIIADDVRAPALPKGVPVLYAHGDIDDHLRLTTQLGHSLGERLGLSSAQRDTGRANIPWANRLGALKFLIREAHNQGSAVACLVDPDALLPSTNSADQLPSWSDATFSRERRELFNVLKGNLDNGGWWWIRPTAGAAVDTALTEVATSTQLQPTDEDFRFSRVSVALRKMARGLVDFAGMEPGRLDRFVQHTPLDVLDLVILELAYDSLHIFDLRTAWRLAVQRGAPVMNGRCGALPWLEGGHRHGIEREAVGRLAARGWLVQTGERLYMPTVIRRFLADWADLENPSLRKEVHRLAAEVIPAASDLVGKMERHHHHAVAVDDVELAIETANFYGADLRRIAVRQSYAENWPEAAQLYQKIVDDFDATDAYAWEYLGYNLMKDDGEPERIRAAYRKAASLDSWNPLYRGRLVEFCWAQGDSNQRAEFDRGLNQFLRDPVAVGWFAKPVLQMLKKRGNRQAFEEIRRDWGWLLQKSPRLEQSLPW